MRDGYARSSTGNLSFFNQDLKSLAEKYGTPLYVFSEQQIIDNILSIREAFAKTGCNLFDVAYPLKANSLLEIIKVLNKLGTKFEVCSEEEIFRCIKLGIEPNRILYSNISKSSQALKLAISYGTIIAIDSLADYFNISNCIQKSELPGKYPVFIRMNPLLEEISGMFTSGTYQGKFGLLPHEINQLIEKIIEDDIVDPIGIQIHLASQILDPELYSITSSSVIQIVKEIEQKFPSVKFQFLDFGGGFPVNYHHNKEPIDFFPYANNIFTPLLKAGFHNRIILIEPGRATISNTSVLLLSTSTIKKHPTQGNFIVVDASIYSVLMDAIFFDWYFEIEMVNYKPQNEKTPTLISGNTSDSSDVLGRWKPLKCDQCGHTMIEPLVRDFPDINIGDILAVKDAGAYTISFNNNFCGSLKPSVILITKEGDLKVIRRAESIMECIMLELPFIDK